jgi:hypothetical protein
MGRVKVKNINGTSDKKCNCGSWINHWKNHSNRFLPFCCASSNCFKFPEVGTHVRLVNGKNRKHYIVPFCDSCNKTTSSDFLVEKHYLVPANKANTCGK